MKYFPLTIVDDFFPDVEYVLDLAKNIEYQDLRGFGPAKLLYVCH